MEKKDKLTQTDITNKSAGELLSIAEKYKKSLPDARKAVDELYLRGDKIHLKYLKKFAFYREIRHRAGERLKELEPQFIKELFSIDPLLRHLGVY